MNEKVKARALRTFDNLESIIKRDQMAHVGYIDGEVNEKLAAEGAVCGGHKACFVGSAYLAYGLAPIHIKTGWNSGFGLNGVQEQKRYVGRRPALKVVWDACNRAAARRLSRLDEEEAREAGRLSSGAALEDATGYEGHAEFFFEDFSSELPRDELRKRMLSLVRSARREVEAA